MFTYSVAKSSWDGVVSQHAMVKQQARIHEVQSLQQTGYTQTRKAEALIICCSLQIDRAMGNGRIFFQTFESLKFFFMYVYILCDTKVPPSVVYAGWLKSDRK